MKIISIFQLLIKLAKRTIESRNFYLFVSSSWMVMDESYVDGDCDGRLQQLMRQSVSNKSAIVKCRANNTWQIKMRTATETEQCALNEK